MSRTSSELTDLLAVIGECDCEPVGCCDWCEVEITWTLTASATTEFLGVETHVEFSWTLTQVFILDNDPPVTPDDPPAKTFHTDEYLTEEACELITDFEDFETVEGTYYAYDKTVSTGIKTWEETATPLVQVSSFDLFTDCSGDAPIEAGSPVAGYVNFKVTDFGSIQPSCLLSTLQPNRSIEIQDKEGGYSRVDSDPCSGSWDSSDVSETVTVTIRKCNEV